MAERKPAAPPAAPTEAELREVMMRGEQMRQQLAALESQRELVIDLTSEARRALVALEHMATAKEGDETLVPVGAGTFVRARLASPQTAIAALGSSMHAEVTVEDARQRMKARVESLEGASTQLAQEVGRVGDELQRLNALLEQAYGGE